ncbi:hypothetical protein [Methylorubrum zatmanii]
MVVLPLDEAQTPITDMLRPEARDVLAPACRVEQQGQGEPRLAAERMDRLIGLDFGECPRMVPLGDVSNPLHTIGRVALRLIVLDGPGKHGPERLQHGVGRRRRVALRVPKLAHVARLKHGNPLLAVSLADLEE